MATDLTPVQQQGNNLLLRLYIQPKASRDQLVGVHGNELKVAITAPPVDGKANRHLIKYLAKQFRVKKEDVKVLKGELNRHKTVEIHSPRLIPIQINELLSVMSKL